MLIEDTVCECGEGKYSFNKYCGAFVCDKCGDHYGLARCFCGWNAHTVDPEAAYREQWYEEELDYG